MGLMLRVLLQYYKEYRYITTNVFLAVMTILRFWSIDVEDEEVNTSHTSLKYLPYLSGKKCLVKIISN